MESFNHDIPSHLPGLHRGKVGSWDHDWGCDLLGSSPSDLSKVASCDGETLAPIHLSEGCIVCVGVLSGLNT